MPKKSTIRQKKYDDEHIIRYSLKLNKKNDKDIIDKIESVANVVGSKQSAIKTLIDKSPY